MSSAVETARPPIWFWILAILGIAWFAMGLFQLVMAMKATAESLAAQGFSPEQATAELGTPVWMHVCWGIGVIAGLAGCVMLLMRNKAAVWLLLVALIASVAMFLGDFALGYFTIFGASMLGLSSAVAILAALFWWFGRWSDRRGLLN
jgi:hypothetical protein